METKAKNWETTAKNWRRSPALAGLAASTAVGLILGAIGPFGSYLSGSLVERTLYWVVCLWGGWLVFGLTLPMLKRWADARSLSPWLWAPPAILVLTVVPAALSRMAAIRLWPVVGKISWLEWYGQSLVISTLATLAMLWVTRPRGAVSTAKNSAASADPRDRLPPRLGLTILCLQMEDHYVRVHTPQGSALVLMSLSQAIAGLKDVEGTQTHRSWWVARSAITDVLEDGRKLRLRLSGGLEAPISRARVGALREQGWLTAASPD